MGIEVETGKSEGVVSSIKVFLWSDIHKRRKIGEGGQANIFEVELRPEGRTVVMKELTDFGDFEDKNATFCYEARMMARLQHPNIISFHGVVANSMDITNAGFLSNLILEFLPSGDLENVLIEDDDFVLLPWRSRVVIALQVAQAVNYMHSIGIIHFDIKPANVLLDLTDPTQPLCKICDFGLAMEREADLKFMRGGVGSGGHIAPEMIYDEIGEKLTEKADVYSFGVLLSELLTGRIHPPYDFVENNKHVKRDFFEHNKHHKAVPEWCFRQWRRLMRDCLTCKASTRPDFTEVAARLRDMLAALDSEAMGVDSIVVGKANSAISDDEDSFWKDFIEESEEEEEDEDDEEYVDEDYDDGDDINDDSEPTTTLVAQCELPPETRPEAQTVNI